MVWSLPAHLFSLEKKKNKTENQILPGWNRALGAFGAQMAEAQEQISPVVSDSDLLRLSAIEWAADVNNELCQCVMLTEESGSEEMQHVNVFVEKTEPQNPIIWRREYKYKNLREGMAAPCFCDGVMSHHWFNSDSRLLAAATDVYVQGANKSKAASCDDSRDGV